MTERSPVEILGAILDEVEGLRRTDQRSYLPETLIREARSVFGHTAEGIGTMQLRDPSALRGKIIEHVFYCSLDDGGLVLVCSDGAFLVLEAQSDGDAACIQPASYWGKSLADFLCPADQETAGLITAAQRQELENRQRKEAALDKVERAERAAAAARRDLADLEARLARH